MIKNLKTQTIAVLTDHWGKILNTLLTAVATWAAVTWGPPLVAVAAPPSPKVVTIVAPASDPSKALAKQWQLLLNQCTDHMTEAVDRLAKARRATLADVMAFANQLSAKVAPLLAEE